MNILVIGKTACGISGLASSISAALPGSRLLQNVRDISELCQPPSPERPVVAGLRLEDWDAAPHLRLAAANNELPLKFERVLLVVRDFRDEMVERLLTYPSRGLHLDRCDGRARAWLSAVREKEAGKHPRSFAELAASMNQILGARLNPISGCDHAAAHLLRGKFASVRVVRYEDLQAKGSQALGEALGDEVAERIQLDRFPALDYEPIVPGSWKTFFTHDDVNEFSEAWGQFLRPMNCGDWSGLTDLPAGARPWSSLVIASLDSNGPQASLPEAGSGADVAPVRRRILYVHVAKTGGSTVNDYITSNLPGEEILTHAESSAAWHTRSRWPELERFAFISGHVSLPACAARLHIGDYVRVASFREPAQQLASHLAWVRQLSEPGNESFLAGHPREVQEISRQLRGLDLADPDQLSHFIHSLDGYAVGLFDNAQCRYLARIPHKTRMTQAHLDEALCRLGMIDIVGITEQLDQTLVLIAATMGWTRPAGVTRLNAGKSRFGLDAGNPAFVEAVQSVIWADLILYAVAKKRFLAGGAGPALHSIAGNAEA